MKYYCDKYRHLVCVPFSIENLHKMAEDLNIGKHFFEVSKLGFAHYDIPKMRVEQIMAKCEVVSQKDILRIIKGEFNNNDITK